MPNSTVPLSSRTVPAAADPPLAPRPPAGPPWPPQGIRTERLHIVRATFAHQSHIAALNDREYMRFSRQRRQSHSYESQEQYLRSGFVLDLQIKSKSIGSMSCTIDDGDKVVDLGLLVIPSVSGLGYGKEAWQAVMGYWLKHDYKVEGGCRTDHHAMRKIMSDTGMQYEGRRIGHYLLEDGTRKSWVLYGKMPHQCE